MAFDGLTNGPVSGLNTKRNAMIPVIAKGTSVYSGISYDADAYNYIRKLQDTPGVTLPEAWKKAINKFYVRLKQIGAYDQIDIMYLFIGGRAATHKIEGKNPGGPYDITWNGAVTHNSSGVTGGALANTTIYGNTNFNLSTSATKFSQTDASMGVYIKSSVAGLNIGVSSDISGNPFTGGGGAFVGNQNTTNLYGVMNNTIGNGVIGVTIARSNRGLLTISRSGNIAGTFKGYRRGYVVQTPTVTSATPLNLNVYVAAINRNGTPFGSPNTISFAYVGSSKIDMMSLSICVEKLQEVLGRASYT